MARIPSQVVIQESPISASLDSLTEIVLGIAAQEGKAREAEKDRQFQKSQMYLESNLEALNKSREEHFKLRERATNLGIMELSADKVTDINKTNAFKAIVDTEGESITTSLNALNELNSEIQSNISTYSKGHTIAKNIDADLSGHISSDELLGYQQNEAKIREEQGLAPKPLGEAFTMGIQSWTMDPDKRLEMALRSEDIKQKEIMNKYLEPKLIQEFESGEIGIKTMEEELAKAKLVTQMTELELEYLPDKLKDAGTRREVDIESVRAQTQLAKATAEETEIKNEFLRPSLETKEELDKAMVYKADLTNEQLSIDLDIARQYSDEKAMHENNILKQQSDLLGQELISKEFANDSSKRSDLKQSTEDVILEAKEGQTFIGGKILTSINLELSPGIYTPLSAITTAALLDPASPKIQDFLDSLEESELYKDIAPELRSLYSSILTAKSEDVIPDYELFLGKIHYIAATGRKWESTKDKLVMNRARGGKIMGQNTVNELILLEASNLKKSHKNYKKNYMSKVRVVAKRLLNQGEIDKTEYKTIIEGISWEMTGIMADEKLMENAEESNKNMLELRAKRKELLNLDQQYSQDITVPVID